MQPKIGRAPAPHPTDPSPLPPRIQRPDKGMRTTCASNPAAGRSAGAGGGSIPSSLAVASFEVQRHTFFLISDTEYENTLCRRRPCAYPPRQQPIPHNQAYTMHLPSGGNALL